MTQQGEELKMDYTTTGTENMTFAPSPKWEWDVFGGGLLIANLTINPPLWRRILTRVFLGSRWRKLHETSAK